jgi:hypothetical protein
MSFAGKLMKLDIINLRDKPNSKSNGEILGSGSPWQPLQHRALRGLLS